MTRVPVSRSFRQCQLLVIGLFAFSACADSAPTDPSLSSIARARSGGGNGPTVKSTDPDSATVDTTLDVRVFGREFDVGSRADWAFKGVVSDKIVTNSTQFVSSTELVANITIASNADLGSHDVIVTTSAGKGGIGTELFEVTLKTTATTLPTFGGATAEALAINDAGTVVGYASETNASRRVAAVSYAARWARDAEGQWQVTKLSATSGGRAHALNEVGDAVGGRAGAALAWPASGGEERVGDGIALGINDAGIIVGGTEYGLSSLGRVWTRDAAGNPQVWIARPLPPLEGGTFSLAFAINEHGVIAGSARTPAGVWKAVVWRPEEEGWATPVMLSGTEASPGPSGSFGINAQGDVVGYLRSCSSCSNHAYLWPDGGGSMDLTMMNSSTSTGRANGIENGGRVVGALYLNVPNAIDPSPFLSVPGDAALKDLGTGAANDINNLTARYGQEVVGSRSGSKGAQATVWRVP
jgi:uncharacterized membrane protein